MLGAAVGQRIGGQDLVGDERTTRATGAVRAVIQANKGLVDRRQLSLRVAYRSEIPFPIEWSLVAHKASTYP